MNQRTAADGLPSFPGTRRGWRIACVAAFALLTGCSSFQRLQQEVEELDTRVLVMGRVVDGTLGTGPIYAVVYRTEADGRLTIESAAEVPAA
ncbi:MAG: hypothetical protein ABW067_07670, partial [Rhizobacter sp.]